MELTVKADIIKEHRKPITRATYLTALMEKGRPHAGHSFFKMGGGGIFPNI